MANCPQCSNELRKIRTRSGGWFTCDRCGGKAVPDSQVEEHFVDDDTPASGLMDDVQIADDETCPSCGNLFELGKVDVGDTTRVLGRCDGCLLTWFPDELGRSISEPVPEDSSDPEGTAPDTGPSEAGEETYIQETSDWVCKAGWGESPTNIKKWIPAFLGLPVKLHKTRGNPVGTWLLAAIMVGVYLLAPGDLAFLEKYGFTPNHWYKWGGITLITSFFLHAGLFHLIGNVYYFLVFGQDIEQALGTGRYLLMILGSTLFGSLLYSIIKWGSTLPSIGASAGVAGVLGYFALAYPKQRFGYAFVPIIIYPIWFQLTAYWGFVLWIVMQLYGAHSQIQGMSGVNSLAHIGGAVVGIGLWLTWRER